VRDGDSIRVAWKYGRKKRCNFFCPFNADNAALKEKFMESRIEKLFGAF
jgi:hypothetical protein